ncbi:MAG: EamA family transporter [Candidatus Woesearchaeota archaeon]
MILSAILLAFGAMLSWGIGDFLIQRSTRKIGNVEALAWIGIIGTIGLLPFAIHDFSMITKDTLILLGSLGVLVFIAAIFNFEALKEGKLSVIDVLLEIELPITIAMSMVFLKEILSFTQIMLILLIMIGIILIATSSFAHLRFRLERGVIFAIIASLFMGLVNYFTATSAKNVSPIMAVWAPWFIFSLFCLVIIIRRKGFTQFFSHIKTFTWLIIFMGIFDTLAWVFYAFAVEQNYVSLTTAITEAYPAIALILGVWFNKEKIRWHQYLGAGLALVGSVVLAIL